MQIRITARSIDLTESIKSYVNDKVGKVISHFDYVTDVHVILSLEKDRNTAEAIASVPGNDIVAKSDSHDMYSAIDFMEDKLNKQMRKHKEKMSDHNFEKINLHQE